ncbi:hypothetical protein TL16_g10204 [Triparma laevis f. inornata]|uniref:Uncharacterized protein n=1 Tax=Triparma laevis f. inornata TaxID=1714386 RepID=A0A9W7BCV9_9STRA|nr:hypothetical protein TL16_g10204 [Triparma laevis f. inornata]
MKLYVHFTPTGNAPHLTQAHTAILKEITPTSTPLTTLAKLFLSHYANKHPTPSPPSSISSTIRFKLDEDYDDFITDLKNCREQKQYKKARLLLERALKVDPNNVACHRLLSRLSYDIRYYSKTLSNLKNCLEVQDVKDNEYIDDLVLAAKCCIALDEFNKALDYLESATGIIKEGVYTGHKYRLNHAIICMAECHKNLGKLNESAAITEMVIKKDETFVPALINYADVAMMMGKAKDAISILLTCIVKDQNNNEVKALLSKGVSAEGGIEHVKTNLPLDASTAPAYAFLATIVRDEGHLSAATKLIELAFVGSNMSNKSYALNYLHALELEGKFGEGFSMIKRFLKGLAGTMRGSAFGLADGVTDFYKVLERLEDENGTDKFGNNNKLHTRVKVIEETPTHRGHVIIDGETWWTEIASKASTKHVEYNQEDYDLLAILFTVIKILYHKGNLKLLPDLVKVVEKLRVQSKTEIYRTNIRNENAYYMCATQLLAKSFHRTVQSIPSGSEVIFIFGEIDCREGLILATEKDRYATHEEGMKTCIDIWMKEAGKVIEEKEFNAWIHPVIPVLEETREIVINYNRIFKGKVEEEGGRMKWIDVFEKLLRLRGDGGLALKDEYKLDGTHMNPSYLKLVEDCMAGEVS